MDYATCETFPPHKKPICNDPKNFGHVVITETLSKKS